MATFKIGKVSHALLMSNKNKVGRRAQIATIEHFVPAAAVTAYNAAADDAARAATLIGALIAAENDLSIGVHYGVTVGFSYTDTTAVAPDANDKAYAFDKIGVSFQSDGEFYTSSVPARNNDNIVVGEDGITILTGAGASAEVTAYVTAFNAVVHSEEDATVAIANMYVRS
jgi:hypothetical protein